MADEVTKAELTHIVGTLTALIVELYARQIALAGFLQAAGTLDQPRYQAAIREVQTELNRKPSLASFRSRNDGRALEEIERLLQAMLLPKPSPPTWG